MTGMISAVVAAPPTHPPRLSGDFRRLPVTPPPSAKKKISDWDRTLLGPRRVAEGSSPTPLPSGPPRSATKWWNSFRPYFRLDFFLTRRKFARSWTISVCRCYSTTTISFSSYLLPGERRWATGDRAQPDHRVPDRRGSQRRAGAGADSRAGKRIAAQLSAAAVEFKTPRSRRRLPTITRLSGPKLDGEKARDGT